jgi:hypothetical protein
VPPAWGGIVRAVVCASLAGAVLEVLFVAGSSQPSPVGVFPGGCLAGAMLMRRGAGVRVMIVSVVASLVLAGALWTVFASVQATRWVLVADAALCPVTAVAVGWLTAVVVRQS